MPPPPADRAGGGQSYPRSVLDANAWRRRLITPAVSRLGRAFPQAADAV